MSPCARKLTLSFAKCLCTTAIAGMTLGCSTLSTPRVEPSPLLRLNCPPLQALSDPSFGATTQALIETSVQYLKCRAAALAE
jgi:hypothetical protein